MANREGMREDESSTCDDGVMIKQRSRGQTMLARLCRKKKKKRGTSEHFIKILLRRLKEGKKKTSIINPCFIISLQLSIKDRLLEISLLLSYLYIGITYIYIRD